MGLGSPRGWAGLDFHKYKRPIVLMQKGIGWISYTLGVLLSIALFSHCCIKRKVIKIKWGVKSERKNKRNPTPIF